MACTISALVDGVSSEDVSRVMEAARITTCQVHIMSFGDTVL